MKLIQLTFRFIHFLHESLRLHLHFHMLRKHILEAARTVGLIYETAYQIFRQSRIFAKFLKVETDNWKRKIKIFSFD